jgi:hypothetical protein
LPVELDDAADEVAEAVCDAIDIDDDADEDEPKLSEPVNVAVRPVTFLQAAGGVVLTPETKLTAAH